MDTNDAVKIQQFLKLSNNVTRNEIAGGTGLDRDAVDAVLAVLVSANKVVKVGEANVARYSLATGMISVASAEPEDRRTAEQIWSDNERARVLAEERRLHPEPVVKRYEPSEQEIETELAKVKAVKPLSPEKRHELELSTRNRTPRNPQSVIVK